MQRPDREAIRASAEARRSEARQKAQAMRIDAENAKSRKRNPPPQMVAMPDPTGDTEVDAKADLDAVAKGFRERAKAEARRFELATDSEYWCCLCFQTREQKEAFLGALNLLLHGDKYIDGRVVAQQLGIALPAAEVPYNTSAKDRPDLGPIHRQEVADHGNAYRQEEGFGEGKAEEDHRQRPQEGRRWRSARRQQGGVAVGG